MAALEKFHMAIWSKTLSIALFSVTMLLFLPLIYHFGLALKPATKTAINGHATIESADFLQRKTLALDGQWLFYWKQLLEPEQIQKSEGKSTFIQGHGGWQSSNNNQHYGAIGFATYHLEVELEFGASNLALQIPQIESAYSVYIDKQLMASGGAASDTELSGKPGYNTAIVRIPEGLKQFTITIQVSNYHSSWGGLWAPIVLGDADALHTLQRDKVALSLFIMGALLITAIHSLIQFFVRPTDNIPLVYTCLCLLLFLREFTVEHMSFALSSLAGGFVLITKLNFLSFYAGIPIALYFFHLSFSEEFHHKFCRFIYVLSMLFSAYILFFPTRYFGVPLIMYEVIAVFVMLYILQRVWVATRHKQRGAGVLLIGSLIAFSFALNDILNASGVITTGRFFSLGIIGFIMSQSFVTNNRYNQLSSNNETLTDKLKERNADLMLMSELLETKVEQRTRQLKLANKELKALANNDPLTNTYNRHGLQQYIQAAFERYRRSQECFCILLIDYDHFKEINDSYGHDVGDIVLITGADLIKSGIREQDKLARWGGEEFLVLLPNTDLKGAFEIANKLKDAICAYPIGQPVGVKVSVSGGIAEVQKDDTFETLFKRADDALYQGKQNGRNQIRS
ncbi:sensor domain-containing diguanylate cyclase [Paraglaciecola arctica]|uniref:sensor domain-containing diguanylate cyclase n=1 Tax=Paraglaciecola arctica TaxID=1128911 RepID=UPI001C068AAF|nr:diguanylate cyclase [Paraglaciecola arctica]MBU3003996.1 GGDEF domain-containing protein [Paraglaciecola arctica]